SFKVVDDRQEFFDGVRLCLWIDRILLLDGTFAIVVIFCLRAQQAVVELVQLLLLLLLSGFLFRLCFGCAVRSFGFLRCFYLCVLFGRRLLVFFLFLRHVHISFLSRFCVFQIVFCIMVVPALLR